MPKSKRARIVPTSKVTKNRKERVANLYANVQAAISAYDYIWVFDVQNMRNTFLKDVRSSLSDSRIFMGKTKVLSKALELDSPSSSPGTPRLCPYLTGEVGLLFTSRAPSAIRAYFRSYASSDYARAGQPASRSFRIAPGEVYTHYGVEGGEDDPVPINMEPQLRKLGVPTKIVKGRVVLEEAPAEVEPGRMEDGVDGRVDESGGGYTVCEEGDVLDSRQTAILKILGVQMAEFRVALKAVWSKESGKVEEIEDGGNMDIDGPG
ncbi:MAG: hypothetical protein Q9227_009445 [Pyrenula ochraceoflavens]